MRATEIWMHLKAHVFWKNMLFKMMKDGQVSLQDHLNKIKDIWDQLEAIWCKMDEGMVMITLKCLASSYEHFVETQKYFK